MNRNISENLLSHEFYARPNVVEVSKDLLGCVLCSYIDGEFTSGLITETEAYCGRNDKACHAYNDTRTNRTEVMYGPPGHSYIYLCYGIHHLFNVVTNREGLADAVLIRAIKPLDGIEIIKERRGIQTVKNLANGPGKLSQALAIHTSLGGNNLYEPPIWIEKRRDVIRNDMITSSPRIGVDYAGEDALKEWRFNIDV
jgi:DNA-3-methyladenine glycosylase